MRGTHCTPFRLLPFPMSFTYPGPMRRRTHVVSAIMSLAALSFAVLALAACGGSDDEPPPPTYAQRCGLAKADEGVLELPAPTGQHCVGKASFQVADLGRPETLTADDTDQRELSVKIWYPAPADTGAPRADYLPGPIFEVVKTIQQLPGDSRQPATNAKPDLRMAAQARHPVLLFSPGYGSNVEMYSTLLEDAASHGYVVVGIDHPYISGVTALANGSIAAFGDLEYTHVPMSAAIMVADQRSMVDWLERQNAPGSGNLLSGHLDLSRIGTFGHSIGGSTALNASRADSRIKASINMDGAVWGDLTGPWPKPLMMMLAEDHTSDETIDAVLRNATGTAVRSVLAGAGHNDFSDLKLLAKHYFPNAQAQELEAQGFGRIDANEALQFARTKTISFFASYLQR